MDFRGIFNHVQKSLDETYHGNRSIVKLAGTNDTFQIVKYIEHKNAYLVKNASSPADNKEFLVDASDITEVLDYQDVEESKTITEEKEVESDGGSSKVNELAKLKNVWAVTFAEELNVGFDKDTEYFNSKAEAEAAFARQLEEFKKWCEETEDGSYIELTYNGKVVKGYQNDLEGKVRAYESVNEGKYTFYVVDGKFTIHQPDPKSDYKEIKADTSKEAKEKARAKGWIKESEVNEEEALTTGGATVSNEPDTTETPEPKTTEPELKKEEPIKPEEEKEEDELPPEGEKEYLGNKGGEEYFYFVIVPAEDGTKDLQIQDADDEVVYSAKENQMDAANKEAFLMAGIKELELSNIATEIVDKYLIPEEQEEEAAAEEVQTQGETETPKESGVIPELGAPAFKSTVESKIDETTLVVYYSGSKYSNTLDRKIGHLIGRPEDGSGTELDSGTHDVSFTVSKKLAEELKSKIISEVGKSLPADAKIKVEILEKAPPGEEYIVKKLKKVKNVENPYAIAWSMRKKGAHFRKGPHAGEKMLSMGESEVNEDQYYDIVRFHKDGKKRVVQRHVTLEDAQAHCTDPSTKREGEWFDGYVKESIIGALMEKYGLNEDRIEKLMEKYGLSRTKAEELLEKYNLNEDWSPQEDYEDVGYNMTVDQIAHQLDISAEVAKEIQDFMKSKILTEAKKATTEYVYILKDNDGDIVGIFKSREAALRDIEPKYRSEVTVEKERVYESRIHEALVNGRKIVEQGEEDIFKAPKSAEELDKPAPGEVPGPEAPAPDTTVAGPEAPHVSAATEEPAPAGAAPKAEDLAGPDSAEANIKMQYPEEPFTTTALAYADSIVNDPKVYGAIRNLKWTGAYADGETFLKQAKIVGSYNEFNPDIAQRLVDAVGEGSKFRLAREGSVAVYFTIRDPNRKISLDTLKDIVKADEADETGNPGEARLWWD